MRRIIIFFAAAVWLYACGSVPELHFVSDVPAVSTDAQPSGGDDGGVPDTGGVGADIGSCSDQRPEGARCCDGVWCIGNCDDANCALCTQRCAEQGTLCCGKSGNALCKEKCP